MIQTLRVELPDNETPPSYSSLQKPEPPNQNTLSTPHLPAISVQRPSYVSELVDEKALSLLRSRYPEKKPRRKGRPLSLDVKNWSSDDLIGNRSEQSSPRLKRSSSFKSKIVRTSSEGVQGYKPLDCSFSSEANLFSRERVTSIGRIMSNKSSPTSSVLSSPRLPRANTFFPANNRIIRFDSSDDDDDCDSDTSESNLDFNFNMSRETKVAQWRTPLSTDDNEEDTAEEILAGKKVTGSRGKSAGSVMMKLAKKFSKKNLPITRDDGDGGSLEEENGKWKMKQRSNSVSNLASIDGLSHRSLSMEHLGPISVDASRSGSIGSKNITPQGSPRMVRSWSRGKLNRKSSELDNDSAVAQNFFRSGSRRNLAGDPADALFEAIEQGNVEAVFSLIDVNTIFNILNDDEFLPVDLSVMLGHHKIAQILLDKGAKDSPKFCRDPSSRLSRLRALNNEAERDMYRLKGEFTSQSATNSSGVKDAERRYRRGERRIQLYRRMLLNYEAADVPDSPTNVQLHITSSRSLMVTFSEPENINRATVTRYKIEWCKTDEFKPVVGDFVMTDLRTMEYIIPDLDKGERYFVRVSAYNMKGFGPTCVSNPLSAVPSSWHDLDQSMPRYEGCTDKIHVVAAQFGLTLQTDPIISSAALPASNTPNKTKTMKKPNPLTRMFTSTVKFNKSLKPGVFIASLVYSDETRVLVTTDENIPIVEVSDSTSSSIGADFVWLANLACTWEHVQAMCDISDSYTSSPSVQFRNKLLHAVLDLQNALGVTDLGLLHPVPYKDSHGALVFVIIKYAKDTKSVASGNSSLRWTDLPKLWKRRATPSRTTGLEAFPVPDQIVLDAQEIIAHHYTSTRPLARGLYLGYLKARSSVASMKVICSREYPNVLPHIKIRENPNLNSEEWEWIKSLQSPTACPSRLLSTDPFSLQNNLIPTIDLFLKNLGFSKEEAENHQLYVHEAIELNENITVLLVLPPPDNVCTAPGSSDHFADTPDFVALPINTFEIMQLYTYQRSFMTKFSMVSARLEVELLTAHQQLREAFSKDEVKNGKEKKKTLEDFNSRTDQVWKQMRWIEDAVQIGRDHGAGTEKIMSVTMLRETVTHQMKDVAQMREEARKKEDEFYFLTNGGQDTKGSAEEEDTALKSGYLRVVPSYKTGLARGTSVKLHIENTTTTLEVISLVVNQVAKAMCTANPEKENEPVDLSDFYMIAGIRGGGERVLEPDYRPLQLQVTDATKGRVYLLVKRRSEEIQLNQMITSV